MGLLVVPQTGWQGKHGTELQWKAITVYKFKKREIFLYRFWILLDSFHFGGWCSLCEAQRRFPYVSHF